MSGSLDYTIFADLKPKQRTDEFAARVRQFINKCPSDVDPERPSWLDLGRPYWIVLRAAKCIDCNNQATHLLSYRTGKDWYRVRTKTRRSEARDIVLYLPLIETRESYDLESERAELLDAGHELIAIYDSIIKACS